MKLLIVIPAYNEAENLPRVLEELDRLLPGTDRVVVNDGSQDGTAAICHRAGCPVLDLPANLGLTGCFQTGMRYGYEHGYDAVVQLDGDGQHDPAYVPAMVATMEESGCDLVIGSRFVTEKRPFTLRMVGNALISAALKLTTGQRVTDPTSGMRLYGKRLLKDMAYGISNGPEPDTVAWLLRSGAKMREIQVTMRERVAGKSYLSIGKSVYYMVQMCMNIFFIQWVRNRSDSLCR